MKRKMILSIFIVTITQWYSFFGTQTPYLPHDFYQTYKETALNPETVKELAQSDEFKIKDSKLIAWLKRHKKLLTILASSLVYDYTKRFKRGVKAGNRLLKKYTFKNTAMHNFIFCINVEGKKYWIKIAGPHRIKQLYERLQSLNKIKISKKERDAVIRNTPTYQNASRFARYLLYKKWSDENVVLPFKVPTTYLFTFSQSAPVDDSHCIIIEEDLPHGKNERVMMAKLLGMESEIKDLIINLGLWDLHLDQFVMTDDGDLFYIDLEDRGTCTPDMFFNQDYCRIKANIDNGLLGLGNMLTLFKKLLNN